MKKISKSLAVIISIVMVITLFAGCAVDELKFLDALKKTSTIFSYESETRLDLQVSGTNLSRDLKKSLMPIINSVDEMNVTVNSKVNGSADKKVSKSQSDIKITMADVNTNASVWSDLDQSGATTKGKLIIQLPSIATSFLPVPAMKKYWVMDVPQPTVGLSTTSPIISSTQLNDKLFELLKNLGLKFNVGFDIVKKMPNEVVGAKTLEVYRLSLDDKSLKDLLTYLGNGFADNKEVTTLLKDFLISAIDLASSSSSSSLGQDMTAYKTMIEDAFASFQKDHSAFTSVFNGFMSVIKDIKILGDKGISFDFKVDENGVIVSTTGVIDLTINLDQVGQLLGLVPPTTPTTSGGTLNMTLNYSEVLSNINQIIDVQLPVTTVDNSFDMMNLTKMLTPVALTVNTIADNSTKISGSTEPNAIVTIFDDYYLMEPITLTAKADGSFSTTLSRKLKTGTEVYVNADNDYSTNAVHTTVKDKTPPKAPVVNKVKNTSVTVSGKAEAYAKVYVKKGNTLLASGSATSKGTFSIKIKKQNSKTVLTITARDSSYNTSSATKITVIK